MDLAEIRERYLRAQLAGHRREAVSLVEDCLKQGASVEELQSEVIRAAQDEHGRLWQRDMISIAQEHMASEISNIALTAIFERAPVAAPNGKKVIIGCVEGEEHQLAARLPADMLELAGFDVRFLGGNVPHLHLGRMVREEKPDVIGLSVTMLFNLKSLRDAVSLLRTLLTGALEGQVADDRLADTVDAVLALCEGVLLHDLGRARRRRIIELGYSALVNGG